MQGACDETSFSCISYNVGIRAQDHMLALGLSLKSLNGSRNAKYSSGVPIQSLISKERMKDGSKRDSPSDIMNAAQISIPAIRVILQKTPMIRMCRMNIRERRKPKNI